MATAAEPGTGADGASSSRPVATGYVLAAYDGSTYVVGVPPRGSVRGSLNYPVVDVASTPGGYGYWLVASDGGIFAFGDATFYGSTGALRLNKPIVGMASTPGGYGYWLVASDGGIFAFGDATFYGSTVGHPATIPIVDMAASGSGAGYWLVTADGTVSAFGDAGLFGSAPALTKSMVVGLAPQSDPRLALPASWRAQAVAEHPTLAAWGDGLMVAAPPWDPTVADNLRQLATVPEEAVASVRIKGVTAHVANWPVTSWPEMDWLRNTRPTGWPDGSTWDQVAGTFSFSSKRLLLGGGLSGSISMVRHEFAHAYDITYGYPSHQADWTNLWARAVSGRLVSPYYTQGAYVGMEELHAEAFAALGGADIGPFRALMGDAADDALTYFDQTPL